MEKRKKQCLDIRKELHTHHTHTYTHIIHANRHRHIYSTSETLRNQPEVTGESSSLHIASN